MDNFRWSDFPGQSLLERFPPNITGMAGLREWEDGLLSLKRGTPLSPQWIDNIRRVARPSPLRCPRVFVSHRQIDDKPAQRIAWLAWDEGVHYWLDLIDLDPARNPQVAAFENWLGRKLTAMELGIITAAIIEMALLNCTHVMAVMTINTAGSQWVPYEYGRVKTSLPVAFEAAAWHDARNLRAADLPEYLHLGPVFKDETGIRGYFQSIKAAFPTCPGSSSDPWDKPEPKSLPNG